MTNKKQMKYLVLENDSGGRAALEYSKELSTVIPYRQIHTNGGLDFRPSSSNRLEKSKLERYRYVKCESEEKAKILVEEGFTKLQGTSNVMD